MAGINPATGRFDPYYYAPASNPSILPQTVQQPNGTMWNTYYNIPSPGGSWSGSGATPAPAPAPAPGPAAPPPSAPKYVVNIGTKRRAGGWVDTIQYWSDGSTTVIDSYQDIGARDAVAAMFRNAGLGEEFVNQLLSVVDGVYAANVMPTEAQVLNAIYNSNAYKVRFAGNEEIRKRMANGQGRPGDRLLTPKEYIDLEESYRTVLQESEICLLYTSPSPRDH
jgi:hypothetical protein